MRTFPTADLLAEVARCIPSVDLPDLAGDEVRIPWEFAVALAGDPESASAGYARSALGWREIPEALASVLEGIQGEAVMAVGGGAGVSVRRYVYGDLGWIGLSVADRQLVMTLLSRDEIPRLVTCDAAAAMAMAMAIAGQEHE